MKKNLLIAIWMTLSTTLLLGIVYPLVVTGLAQVLFHHQANGSLIQAGGKTIGSHLIGQPFSSPAYFHPRPSAAGPAGYNSQSSAASNLAPTNKSLIDRVNGDVEKLHNENPNAAIPVDLVTTSGSGLDPDISPAAAEFQIPRISRERAVGQSQIRALVKNHTKPRQLGFLGEPRVNVLELNLDLDASFPRK
ncbi:MAG: potassium-transporting ATPase subunit KdpC [Candidatus Acidiferrales bacterium]